MQMDGNSKAQLREKTRTLKRYGGPARLDGRSKLTAIGLGDPDNWDRDCVRIITYHLKCWSVLVVVDDDSGRAGILRIHRLLIKGDVATLDQHNLPIGNRVCQLGRAVHRLSEDDLYISEFQTQLLRPKVCCRRVQGAASPRDAHTYARTDKITQKVSINEGSSKCQLLAIEHDFCHPHRKRGFLLPSTLPWQKPWLNHNNQKTKKPWLRGFAYLALADPARLSASPPSDHVSDTF